MNSNITDFLKSINLKEELNSEEYQILRGSLVADVDHQGLKDVYLKHKVLNTITYEMLIKKAVENQVEKILNYSIPLEEKSYPVVIFLVLKNYRKLAGNLREFIIKLNDKVLNDTARDPIFENEYFIYLSRLMKNDLRFFKIIIETNRYDANILDVFTESEEPEILFSVSNIKIVSTSLKIIEKLLKNPFTPDESVVLLKQLYAENFGINDTVKSEESKSNDNFQEEAQKNIVQTEQKVDQIISDNIYQKILNMNIPEKIKLGLKGNHTARMILIKDPNKQISLTVLKNPKLTEQEIDSVLKNKSTGEHIISDISRTTQWTRNYNIIKDIVFHPKTPFETSINFIGRLLANDLERLSKSRDISSNLRNYAIRMFNTKSKKK